MFKVGRTIESFESGESDYPENFQGSTMLFPIVTQPLSMETPACVAQGPSLMPVPKLQKKRVICNPQVKRSAAKKPKVNHPTLVVNLTIEVEHPIPANAIVEDIPATTSTAVQPSQEPSPQTTCTSTTLFEILLFGHQRTNVEIEVQLVGQTKGTTSTIGMPPIDRTKLMLGLDLPARRSMDTSW